MRQQFSAEVEDVFSGDDLVAMIDLGVDDLHKRKRVRLHGVDTPNAVGQPDGTEAGQVRAYVKKLCRGKKVRLTVISTNMTSWVAIVEVEVEGKLTNINDALIEQGYEFKRERHNGQ